MNDPTHTDVKRASGATERRIVYCHCAYARVVPPGVKQAVLAGLSDSGVAFDAVPDLCELAARQDPALKRLASGDTEVDVVACYPRAVKWLFHAAEAPLPADGARIHNMRTATAEETLTAVLGDDTVIPAPVHHDAVPGDAAVEDDARAEEASP